MYWTNEFHTSDKEIKHMWSEYIYAAGIFTAVVWAAFLVSNIL